MHDQSRLLESRLTRFVAEHLQPALYRARHPVELTRWTVPGEPVPFAEAVRQRFEPTEVGTSWGRPWGTEWFHVTGGEPAEWLPGGQLPDDTSVELIVDLGFSGGPGFQAEGLAWRPDGVVIKAVSPYNQHVPLDAHAPVDLYLEAAANPDIGTGGFQPNALGDPETAGHDPIYDLRQLEIGLLDHAVWELLLDVSTLDGLMRELPDSTPRRWEILHALSRMLDVIDPDDIAGTAPDARTALAGVLNRPAAASAHRVVAIGHAHIDSAWLWPVRETIRKCARTFANVVALADADPEFRFACSSAQQYAWIEDHYPELFARISEKVGTGQFIPVGGMWVESDTNMPGGEALARQFVTGKRYFLDRFGIDTQEVWLPDSFGYSAALPQIARAAGSQYFLTQKLSWNQTNAMPHHTFWWEGIDGTRVLHPLSAGRHLQQRPVRAGPGPGRAAVPGEGPGQHLPDPVRLRRRRRRADPGDARPSAPGAVSGGLTDRTDRQPAGLLRGGRRRVRAAAHLERGALPRASPRHLHDPGRNQAGQSAQRASAPGGRTVGGHGRHPDRFRLPVRGAGRTLETGAAPAVPRHPARQLDRLGARRRRAQLRGCCRAVRDGDRVGRHGPGRHRRSYIAAERGPACAGRGSGPRGGGTGHDRPAGQSGPGRRRHRARQRAGPGGHRRGRPSSPHWSTRSASGRPSRPARTGIGCSCTATSPTNGTPGTSTSTTAGS